MVTQTAAHRATETVDDLVLYRGGARLTVMTGGMFPCAVCLSPTARVLSCGAIKSAPDHLVARVVPISGGRFVRPFVGLPLCAVHLPSST